MNSKEVIFIFTRDRPEVLNKTLSSIDNLTIGKYIIDDSFNELNIRANKKLLLLYSNVFYYGQNEFDEIVKTHNIDSIKYKSIFRRLGNIDWNLGYARNFALLLSKIISADKVLFMDDDLFIPNIDIVYNSFNLLELYNFVGTNISGMIDDSIMGFISNDLDFIDNDERALSGGFLAFEPQKIKIPFINVYNEDWIWLFLHSNENKHLQKSDIYQNFTDPYLGYKGKIEFQEIGEIIILGILALNQEKDFKSLTSGIFWSSILNDRNAYLIDLQSAAKLREERKLKKMIEYLLVNHKKLESDFFLDLFNSYDIDKKAFTKLYNSI